MTTHTHDPGEPGLAVEMHLREHMAGVHEYDVDGHSYEALYEWHTGEHPELSDPEMLPPPEKIRYAEQLIRREHRVLDDDWLFWGQLADYLNQVAHTPDKRPGYNRESDWREFNRAQTLAAGYIRMSARPAVIDFAAVAAALHEHCNLGLPGLRPDTADDLTAHLAEQHSIRFAPSHLEQDPLAVVRVHRGRHPDDGLHQPHPIPGGHHA